MAAFLHDTLDTSHVTSRDLHNKPYPPGILWKWGYKAPHHVFLGIMQGFWREGVGSIRNPTPKDNSIPNQRGFANFADIHVTSFFGVKWRPSGRSYVWSKSWHDSIDSLDENNNNSRSCRDGCGLVRNQGLLIDRSEGRTELTGPWYLDRLF